MSLTRQFLREFRPLFRMLEEPFGRPIPTRRGGNNVSLAPFGMFNDPFFSAFPSSASSINVPAVDVSEEPNAFVVEAELPGVKKENVDLRIGDGGQSLTIEGRRFVSSQAQPREGEAASTASASTQGTSAANDDARAVTQSQNESTQLSTERTFSSASQFSRTIWLPRRVDGSGVSAKLEDGILRVRIPKAEDQESVKVNIE